MPFDKQPTPPTPEQEAKMTTNREEIESRGKTAEQRVEANEHTASVLGPENRSFFGRMSEGGRKIANQVYENLYKIPGVNRVVGKLEIAYNQFWIDRHQENAVRLKEKMDNIDLKVGALDQSKKDIESAIENLKSRNIPGAESLQIKLQDIERQKATLLNEKDRVQSKFEARDNKLKLYTNERDRVADKLIRSYDEKLKPMEAELERLQTLKDEADLRIAVAEAEHKGQLEKLVNIEKEKTRLEEALRRTGMSEKEVRKFAAVKQLDKVLSSAREKMRIEKENLARRKAEINKRIAKVDAKANPYRDKREEFVRVKEGRPIKIDVGARQRGIEFKGEEEVKAHPRGKAAQRGKEVHGKGRNLARTKEEGKVEEESAKDKKRLQTAAYLNGWNAFLKKTYKDAARFIDPKDFLKATGLSEDYRLDFEDFKNILGKYLKYRKIPTDQFNKSIDEFFKQEIKAEK